jgi:hypothetical protein
MREPSSSERNSIESLPYRMFSAEAFEARGEQCNLLFCRNRSVSPIFSETPCYVPSAFTTSIVIEQYARRLAATAARAVPL